MPLPYPATRREKLGGEKVFLSLPVSPPTLQLTTASWKLTYALQVDATFKANSGHPGAPM